MREDRQAHSEFDAWHMRRALELAARGQGLVEPNPMVGCVIVQSDGTIVGEGWHRQFGGPHAEIEALQVAGTRAAGATLYVSLEPCCHHGKTPPCTEAIVAAGVRRVVAALRDPFPAVAGGGMRALQTAGIEFQIGLTEDEARRLNAPYLRLVEEGRPWIIAKWAMTLDGKMASRSGDSRWISCEDSRRIVHHLRGRVDAIMVGSTTALADDPQLTARPAGSRVATRVVVDSRAALPLESQLVRTAHAVPVLVAAGPAAPTAACEMLRKHGCEVFVGTVDDPRERLRQLLLELGRRRMTNVLVEGGGRLLGSLFDLGQIDEVHTFIAPKLIGGEGVVSPLAGVGVSAIEQALLLDEPQVRFCGSDVYVTGRVKQP